MGKKNKQNSDLGRSLIKDRFSKNKGRKLVANNSMLHTTDLQDGYDWGRLNLQSVTEESSFQEFLSTAELAGTEFQAEKLNIKFVNPRCNVGLLSEDEKKLAKDSHNANKELLKIPRRPRWNSETTPEQLQQNEKESFLEWRRNLAKLQEDDKILLTPYEKNLEFWRQLWRVVERSDVIVQIVDARNPLLFRCEDLELYVKEVSKEKLNLILINKADYLTEIQRQYWADYFTSVNVHAVFFSALLSANENLTPENVEESKTIDVNEIKKGIEKLEVVVEETANKIAEITKQVESTLKEIEGDCSKSEETSENNLKNISKIYTREDLIELFKIVHKGLKVTNNITTIGLVGYPNVGKSSTINSLMQEKKVSVSATPGKTKHFQTLYLNKDVLLCDCPGLVMPSFVFTKAEMIINGILPIDQMRDHVPPINLINSLIPKHVIEDMYGIILPLPMEGEDPDRNPTSEELLNVYAYYRGFMTANGQPDNARAARYVLKDFVNGKLLYCHAPPGIQQLEYHNWPERKKIQSTNYIATPREVRISKPNHLTTADLDRAFFNTGNQGVHVKGKAIGISNNLRASVSGNDDAISKPWKKINRHENKKKHEKLRRIYSHLDQH